MVYQQIHALAVLDTATARQKGYPQRVSFQEFIRRFCLMHTHIYGNLEDSLQLN